MLAIPYPGMHDGRALVVDIDGTIQPEILGFLHALGYECVHVASVGQALQVLTEGGFSVTLVDLSGNGTDEAATIRSLKLAGRNCGPIIAVTNRDGSGAGTAVLGVEALLHKPINIEELEQVLDTPVRPTTEALVSASEQVEGRIRYEMNLCCSPKMMAARQILREAARVDVTVLVTGETGTGKELVARAIHHFSARRTGPFVKVNCAAMPRELLESELFGYERGAFTGAHKLKIGKFEAAHRGTIFLDEIGDLHPALQAKLLHVLQDGEFSRIGGKSTLTVDVRVLAATNQNLERAVIEGRFREDLFYRLNVVQVFVPPLRERASEIPVLANYFVQRYAKLYRRDGFSIPPLVMERLALHRYPGNVRELENLIKRMIVLDDPFLTRISLPETGSDALRAIPSAVVDPDPSLKEIARRASQAAERDAIAKMLEQTGWNRVRAAKALRISYRALLYKIKQAGLEGSRTNGRSASTSLGTRS